MSLHVSFPGKDCERHAVLSLPLKSFQDLCDQVEQKLEISIRTGLYVLSDTMKDISTDEDVRSMRDGSQLIVVLRQDGALPAPTRERITFQPHPKTITMAGDYEYFAAQVCKSIT